MKKGACTIWLGMVTMGVLTAAGCASFRPVPLNEVPYKERAVTQSSERARVTVVALSPDESRKVFGVNLDDRDIQPVGVEI